MEDVVVISTSWGTSRVTCKEDGIGAGERFLGAVRAIFGGDSALLRLVGVSGASISSMSTSDSTCSDVAVEANLRFCGESLDGSARSGVFFGDLRGVAVTLIGEDRFV
jgi:hypothetical protein